MSQFSTSMTCRLLGATLDQMIWVKYSSTIIAFVSNTRLAHPLASYFLTLEALVVAFCRLCQ